MKRQFRRCDGGGRNAGTFCRARAYRIIQEIYVVRRVLSPSSGSAGAGPLLGGRGGDPSGTAGQRAAGGAEARGARERCRRQRLPGVFGGRQARGVQRARRVQRGGVPCVCAGLAGRRPLAVDQRRVERHRPGMVAGWRPAGLSANCRRAHGIHFDSLGRRRGAQGGGVWRCSRRCGAAIARGVVDAGWKIAGRGGDRRKAIARDRAGLARRTARCGGLPSPRKARKAIPLPRFRPTATPWPSCERPAPTAPTSTCATWRAAACAGSPSTTAPSVESRGRRTGRTWSTPPIAPAGGGCGACRRMAAARATSPLPARRRTIPPSRPRAAAWLTPTAHRFRPSGGPRWARRIPASAPSFAPWAASPRPRTRPMARESRTSPTRPARTRFG